MSWTWLGPRGRQPYHLLVSAALSILVGTPAAGLSGWSVSYGSVTVSGNYTKVTNGNTTNGSASTNHTWNIGGQNGCTSIDAGRWIYQTATLTWGHVSGSYDTDTSAPDHVWVKVTVDSSYSLEGDTYSGSADDGMGTPTS